jgi:hypothetical protein
MYRLLQTQSTGSTAREKVVIQKCCGVLMADKTFVSFVRNFLGSHIGQKGVIASGESVAKKTGESCAG